MNAPFTPDEVARALGGRVVGRNKVRAPAPGMPPTDESLEIKFDSKYADGFTVRDYYGGGDDWRGDRDYVRDACNRPFEPSKPKDDPLAGMNARASKEKTQRQSSGARPPDENIVATYDYTESNGALLYQAVRYDPKDFRQRRPDGKGGWIWKSSDRSVPYRWPDIVKYPDATVFVTEGEKDADRLASLGHCATTIDGRGNWSSECIDALQWRDVFILEDNDDKGQKRAVNAAKALHGTAASVRVVKLPDLPERGDVSDWLNANPARADSLVDICLATPVWELPKDEADPTIGELPPLTLSEWSERELPPPDFMMGYWLTTTTRCLLTAATGLGKSNFAIALGMRAAAGVGFLHWRDRRPVRVLYIDGEMSRRLLKERLAYETARLGIAPETFRALSREDIENFPPLNTPEGQEWIYAFIQKIGGIDLLLLDNIMSLTLGDQKDPLVWQQTLPFALELTRRAIGQIWIHHAGHDATKGYGDKSREWQMDTVIHLDVVKRDDTDVSFQLSFKKARERTPATRDDFQDVKIALVDDRWRHDISGPLRPGKISPQTKKALDALTNVLAGNQVTNLSGNRRAAHRDHWQAECSLLGLIDQAKPDSARSLFSKFRRELVAANLIACEGDLSWRVL